MTGPANAMIFLARRHSIPFTGIRPVVTSGGRVRSMPRRGIFVGDTGNRLRVAGSLVEISSPGRDGSYKLIVTAVDEGRIEISLSEDAVDELEEVIAALRMEQPKYENLKSYSPLVMKKFMLDNAVFPKWPASEMVSAYRRESALVSRDEILKWRMALKVPDEMRSLYAMLALSVTRREGKEYRQTVLDEVADTIKMQEPRLYAELGRTAVIGEIEQNLLNAYPNDALDGAGILADARANALVQIFSSAKTISQRKYANKRLNANILAHPKSA